MRRFFVIAVFAGVAIILIASMIDKGSEWSYQTSPSNIEKVEQRPSDSEFQDAVKNHPTFRVFSDKPNQAISLVVAPNTDNDGLRHLLWYVRIQVRSGHFKNLGIVRPTAKQWGEEGYKSGMIIIFRGSRCAGEADVTTGAGPCGYGEHDDAYYQWGIDNNPNKDIGALVDGEKGETLVFDASDNWLPNTLMGKGQSGAERQAEDDRVEFAREQTIGLYKNGSDMTLRVTKGTELDMRSFAFASEHERQAYLLDFFLEQRDKLCQLGFKTVRLGQRTEWGKSYPIPCISPN